MATKKAARGKGTGKGKPAPQATLLDAGNPPKPPSPQATPQLLAPVSVAATGSPPKPPSLLADQGQQKQAAAVVVNAVANPPKPPRLEGELIELLELRERSPAGNALLLLILAETFADVAEGLPPDAPARKLVNDAANHLFAQAATQAKSLQARPLK